MLLLKAVSIRINVHNEKDRQILLVDDETGEQKELSFDPDRITTSFIDDGKERMFDYYGREIQISDSIAEIIEQTGRFWLNKDQECFLVKLKDGLFAIASVNYYYPHSGGHEQQILEFNSRLNQEYWREIGQIWLEPIEDRIMFSYDKNIIKDSCIGYFLEETDRNAKDYWLLNAFNDGALIYNAADNDLLCIDIYDSDRLAKYIGYGPAKFKKIRVHQDKQGFTCQVKIGREIITVGTSLEVIKHYFSTTKKRYSSMSLPTFLI